MPVVIEEDLVNTEGRPPLSSLKILVEDGIWGLALDKVWVQKMEFTEYISIVLSGGRIRSGIDLDEWEHVAKRFQADMEYLLNRPHHVFWSYMMFQKAALASIVTFLQRATPFYIELGKDAAMPEKLVLYEHILNLVVRVICRLLTNKESPDCWITRKHMKEMVYNNFLISVPMLFDLTIAVGNADAQNIALLSKIFGIVLQLEPAYKKDFVVALEFFRGAFRSIQTQAENEGADGAGGGTLEEGSETTYDDVVLYTLDCGYSLSVVLEVCPDIRASCNEIGLGQSIAQFYDSTIPFLYKNICMINEVAASLNWLNQARLQFLKAFRSIAYSYVEQILTDTKNSIEDADSFIGLMTECISENVFVVDYQREYPIALDMEILKQACNLDALKASFVVQAYENEATAEAVKYATMGGVAKRLEQQDKEIAKAAAPIQPPNNKSNQIKGPIEHIPVAKRDIDREVAAVIDVLPYFCTEFVRCVLARYANSDEAITAILEDNLPPDLLNVDPTEAYIPPDAEDTFYHETGIRHNNIFDGGKTDDRISVIKQGKGFPNAPQNVTQLLDDKQDLEKIRHRYQEYGLVAESDNEHDEYEDEYDDSYEALLESESRTVKSKVLRSGFAIVNEDASNGESETEDESADDKPPDDNKYKQEKGLNFCENPETVRARNEARRESKWQSRNGACNKTQKASDVVGSAKGTGQAKETLRNRDKKEKNKSSRANHNRKAGAAFKRSKGMMS